MGFAKFGISGYELEIRETSMKDIFDEWISSLIGLLLVALTFWVIGWSFYRHGTGHGIAAAFIPLYAWYR